MVGCFPYRLSSFHTFSYVLLLWWLMTVCFALQEKSFVNHQTTSWIHSQEPCAGETISTLWIMIKCCCEVVYSETLSGALDWLSLRVWLLFFSTSCSCFSKALVTNPPVIFNVPVAVTSSRTNICFLLTGLQTKLMQNCGGATFKRTSIDKLMNTLVLWVSNL